MREMDKVDVKERNRIIVVVTINSLCECHRSHKGGCRDTRSSFDSRHTVHRGWAGVGASERRLCTLRVADQGEINLAIVDVAIDAY